MAERIGEIKLSLSTKSREELIEELARIKWQLEQIPPYVRELILGIGLRMRVMMRNFMPFEGILTGLDLEPKMFRIYYEMTEKPYGSDIEKRYSGTVDIPRGSCARWFIVYAKEERRIEKE